MTPSDSFSSLGDFTEVFQTRFFLVKKRKGQVVILVGADLEVKANTMAKAFELLGEVLANRMDEEIQRSKERI